MTIENKTANEQQIMNAIQQVSNKLDLMDKRFDKLEAQNRKTAAITGGVAGGVAGLTVSTGFALLKAKFGL